MTIDLEELKRVLSYDPDTGEFRWRERTSYRVSVGKIAGTINKRLGYCIIRIHGNFYYAHRLAWFFMFGEWPDKEIDHINGKKSDNRISNLRQSQRWQNSVNYSRKNKTGFRGVSFRHPSWRARIKVARKIIILGTFDSPEKAHAAYVCAAKEYHNEFALEE